jgi:hypothetical protein
MPASNVSRGRLVLPIFLALAAGLFVAGSVVAQPPRGSDLLDQYRNRNMVAAQAFENEIRDALAGAQKAAAADPAKAVDLLKKALAKVDADESVLTATRRDSLKRDIKERLRVAESDGKRTADLAAERGQKAVQAVDQKAAQDRQAADQEKVARQLNEIAALRADGKTEEANRRAAELAARYPDVPAAQSGGRTTTMADRVQEARRLQSETEQRRLAASLDVDKSNVLPRGDIDYGDPAKWRELTKRRKMVQLTEAEKALLDALNAPITLDLKNAKFEEVIDYLETKMGQSIMLDQGALEAAGVKYESPVNVRARKLATRTVLRSVLSGLGLTYVIKDQAIQVTTPEKAKQMLTMRTYYIGDLLGPGMDPLTAAATVDTLIRSIYAVDPDSWLINDRGGLGTIAYSPTTGALVIKQSAEVHWALGNSLR